MDEQNGRPAVKQKIVGVQKKGYRYMYGLLGIRMNMLKTDRRTER